MQPQQVVVPEAPAQVQVEVPQATEVPQVQAIPQVATVPGLTKLEE